MISVQTQASAVSAAPVSAVRSRSTVSKFSVIDISAHCNNCGISTASRLEAGQFNVWGNSFPAEHLPSAGEALQVANIPFTLAGSGAASYPNRASDNIRCAGQYIPLPVGKYDWIHVLAASERRTEDTVALHFADSSVDFEVLRISDFWAEAQPAFGDRKAFETPVMHYPHHIQQRVEALMWSQRVAVSRRSPLRGMRLPRNAAIHIFALTMQEEDAA